MRHRGAAMRLPLSDRALTALYAGALRARGVWWWITKPLLVGVRILVIQGDHVLLVRHRSGPRPWSLPGGGVGRREPLEQAARRECYEEAGAMVQIERLHGMYHSFALGITNHIAVFVAQGSATLIPRDTLEIAEARYFPMDALPEGIERGSARRIDEHRARKSGLTDAW
ncbi:NUDIX domain-containing protein [Chloroflexia bacterium SDU3-3]|nr:NUDIX domain-containing protein [Chloroflexia bacterium SDU3-3]